MYAYIIMGAIGGFAAWIGKFVIISLASPKKFKTWLHNSIPGMITLDLGMGLLSMQIFSMAGGTIAMFSSIAFGLCTTVFIGWMLLKRKCRTIFKGGPIWQSEQPSSWY